MTNHLARVDLPSTEEWEQLQRMAKCFQASGFFKEARDMARAMTQIMFGWELGISPLQALTQVHVIDGKPTAGAHMIASAIKRHPDYDYRVVEHTDKFCTVAFFERGEPVGEHSFSMKDAQDAGLLGKRNWKAHPKAMLFARAVSQGYRYHIPGALAHQVYERDELEEVRDVQAEVRDAPGPVEAILELDEQVNPETGEVTRTEELAEAMAGAAVDVEDEDGRPW